MKEEQTWARAIFFPICFYLTSTKARRKCKVDTTFFLPEDNFRLCTRLFLGRSAFLPIILHLPPYLLPPSCSRPARPLTSELLNGDAHFFPPFSFFLFSLLLFPMGGRKGEAKKAGPRPESKEGRATSNFPSFVCLM